MPRSFLIQKRKKHCHQKTGVGVKEQQRDTSSIHGDGSARLGDSSIDDTEDTRFLANTDVTEDDRNGFKEYTSFSSRDDSGLECTPSPSPEYIRPPQVTPYLLSPAHAQFCSPGHHSDVTTSLGEFSFRSSSQCECTSDVKTEVGCPVHSRNSTLVSLPGDDNYRRRETFVEPLRLHDPSFWQNNMPNLGLIQPYASPYGLPMPRAPPQNLQVSPGSASGFYQYDRFTTQTSPSFPARHSEPHFSTPLGQSLYQATFPEETKPVRREDDIPWRIKNILADKAACSPLSKSKEVPEHPRYNCDGCGKTYSTFSGVSKHRQFHCTSEVKKRFSCKHCEKVYTSLGALKMHIRTHTLPCKCKICGKSFSRPWLLQGHVRTHTGEKPFNCAHCGRSFADRSNLRAHLQTHSDVKKYCCKFCSKTFSRMSLLLKHEDGGCTAMIIT